MDVKRIIMSVGMLAFAGAVVVGGTGAFFSSQTASTGNVFTAGAVDLVIKAINHTYTGGGVDVDVPSFDTSSTQTGFSFTLDDIKPLDKGTITYELENRDNPIHLCVMVDENSAKSITPNPPAKLANHLSFKFGNNTGLLSAVAGQWYNLGQVAPGPVTLPYSVDYCFGAYDVNGSCALESINYNPLQNSALGVDVNFYAVQTRNNANFDCASLNTVPEIITIDSAVLNYSGTGWAGWSCPSTHPNIVDYSTNAVLPLGESIIWKPGAQTSGGVQYPNTPHGYTYSSGETGVIIQNGGTSQSVVITLQCQAN